VHATDVGGELGLERGDLRSLREAAGTEDPLDRVDFVVADEWLGNGNHRSGTSVPVGDEGPSGGSRWLTVDVRGVRDGAT
jgi:hypothetical protein